MENAFYSPPLVSSSSLDFPIPRLLLKKNQQYTVFQDYISFNLADILRPQAMGYSEWINYERSVPANTEVALIQQQQKRDQVLSGELSTFWDLCHTAVFRDTVSWKVLSFDECNRQSHVLSGELRSFRDLYQTAVFGGTVSWKMLSFQWLPEGFKNLQISFLKQK